MMFLKSFQHFFRSQIANLAYQDGKFQQQIWFDSDFLLSLHP